MENKKIGDVLDILQLIFDCADLEGRYLTEKQWGILNNTSNIKEYLQGELNRAREEGRKELLDSIINGIKQLRDIVGIVSPMSSKIRARQEGEISAYNDILGKLSKLTTK